MTTVHLSSSEIVTLFSSLKNQSLEILILQLLASGCTVFEKQAAGYFRNDPKSGWKMVLYHDATGQHVSFLPKENEIFFDGQMKSPEMDSIVAFSDGLKFSIKSPDPKQATYEVGVCFYNSKDEKPIDWLMFQEWVDLFIELVETKLRFDYLAFEAMRSHLDQLTGLFNRRVLEVLTDFFKEYPATFLGDDLKKPFAFFLDIDLFKSVNTIGGHSVGDQILKQLADIMRAHSTINFHLKDPSEIHKLGGALFADVVRKFLFSGLFFQSQRTQNNVPTVVPTYLAVRYGGEEFCGLIWVKSLNQANEVLELLLNSFRRIELPDVLKGQWSPSFSAGLCPYSSNLSTSLNAANALMLQAKDAGRNQIMVQKET